MKARIGLPLALGLSVFAGWSPATATPADLARISKGCQANFRAPESHCDCITKKAAAELNDVQQSYVAAHYNLERNEAATISLKMTVAEREQAVKFIDDAIKQCLKTTAPAK